MSIVEAADPPFVFHLSWRPGDAVPSLRAGHRQTFRGEDCSIADFRAMLEQKAGLGTG